MPMRSVKTDAVSPLLRSREVELKLALTTSDPSGLAQCLARTPLLARRKPTRVHLHNVYYDTPEQALRQQRVALRIRRKGSEARPQWLQTLKTGGNGDSALSTRGEWEWSVPGPELVLDVLQTATPWPRIDPDGKLFGSLRRCFVTDFERTTWLVRRRDGSLVEVAFDVGHIAAGSKTAAICELELELLSGQPQVLFDIAQQLATTIAVLPLNASKAERGYALTQDAVDAPVRARPVALTPDLALAEAARRILRETFGQFTANVNTLRGSNDPEVVHQARVGWRRFSSAGRLFRSSLAAHPAAERQALQPLLSFLGALRDHDVAGTETLPPLAQPFVAGDSRRAGAWESMAQALQQAASLLRKSVRYALEDPALGAALLATTRWLELMPDLQAAGNATAAVKMPLRRWAKRRIDRHNERLEQALRHADSPETWHRVRILCKRMRYDIEALQPLLPKRRTQRRYQNAVRLQADLGAQRDLVQASLVVNAVEADRALVEFLRGVAVGKTTVPKGKPPLAQRQAQPKT